MKKINSTLLLFALILTFLGLGWVASARVAIGSRSDEVKEIQEILKTDPDIYPEGYVTGYFGSLTEKAIRKLQKRCGLPETGELDDATEKCIYPIDYKVKVAYPNGGEVLDRNTIQTIKWEVIEPGVSAQEIKPFWPKASIDLFRRVAITMPCAPGETCEPVEKSVFVKHIATVNLFDQTYSWKITPDISNGTGYAIRISLGKKIVTVWYREIIGQSLPSASEIWPQPAPPIVVPPSQIIWDESDGTFEITGEITPECPTCPVCPNSEEIIASLTRIIEELQKLIASLRTSH